MKFFNWQHLTQVEESYWQHFKFSLWAGVFLVFLGTLSVLHAVFPFLFSRYPDYLFHKFVDRSAARRNRVDSILKEKNLE